MPKRIQTVYVCDICDHESDPGSCLPTGWVSFCLGGRHEGTVVRDVLICPRCTGLVSNCLDERKRLNTPAAQ